MDKVKKIPMPARYAINTLLLAAFLLVGNTIITSGAVSRAQSSIILQIGIYIILAVSLNVVTGYLGQLPLGHAGFMAVGAYAGALFWNSCTLPRPLAVILGLVIAGIVAAVFGVNNGLPALRPK